MKNLKFNVRKAQMLLLAVGLLVTSLITPIWAGGSVSYTGGYIYFDNSSTQWADNYVQIMMRQTSWAGICTMNKLSNTKLFYVKDPEGTNWGDCWGWAIVWASSAWNNGNFENTGLTKYSAYSTYGISGSYYLAVPASTSNGFTLNCSYNSTSAAALLDKTHTVGVKVKMAGASSYTAPATTPGAIKGESYKMNSWNGTTATTATLSGSTVSTTFKGAYTAKTKYTAPTITGYTFQGWYNSSGTRVSTSAEYTFYPTTPQTLYAYYSENTYTVSFANDGHGTTSPSSNQTVGQITGIAINATPSSGYSFNTWTSSSGGSFGSAATTASNTFYPTANTTLTASFNEDLTYYTVTYGVGTGYTSYGSLSAKVTSTSAAITSGDNLLSGTGVTFTASPNTGYEVEGWYTNASCTIGKHDAGSTTYSTTLSGNTTVYVKFVKTTYSITYSPSSAPTGCTYTTTPTTGQYGDSKSITITPATGYSVSVTSSDATLSTSGNTTTFTMPAKNVTINVTATEKKSTITVTTATTSYGTLEFGNTSKSWGTTASVGVATTQNITATAASGFKFVRWDLSGAAASSSTLTNKTITLKADGSGGTGTATAVFEEDLESTWYVEGDASGPFLGWKADATTMLMKKTGYSTSNDVYWTATVTAAQASPTDTQWEFKIFNSAGATETAKWYGWGTDDNYYWLTNENNSLTLSNSTNNVRFKPYLAGEYEFHFNTSTKVLTVTWPVINQVRISAASPTDATNTGNFDLGAAVSNVRSVTRSLNAGTTYTFKVVYASDWYGFDSGTFTRNSSTSSNSLTTSTSGGDMTLTTDYAGNYTFKFNESTKALSVDFPTAYKITFGKGSVNGTSGSFSAVDLDNSSSAVTSNSTWVKSGNRVKITAPSAKTGYELKGWYDNNSGTGDAITTNANCTISVTAATTVYACYRPKTSALSFDYQTSDPGYKTSGTISAASSATYDAAMPALSGNVPTAKDGYAFIGFYDGTGDGAKKYYNADKSAAVSKWDKNTTSGTTLYAHYKKAEITGITFDPGTSVEHGQTVTVTAEVSPTPTGNTVICWRVLYSNDNPLNPQPTFDPASASGTTVSFTAPETSATYKVEAKLQTGTSCGAGTLLDTKKPEFTVSGTHTVTVNYKCGDEVIKAATTTTARPAEWTDAFTAPDIFGYTFARWDAADGVTIKNGDSDPVTTTTNATIQIKAVYNGKLTAVYTQKSLIYFKNTLGWSNVYVNFYDEWGYWTTNKGSGNKGKSNCNLAMTRIGETDVWYYDYGAASITPQLPVSFTSESQDNMENFWKVGGVNVVYPDNYPDDINTDKSSENGFKEATPMFVPLATQDGQTLNQSGGGKAVYYNAGYWTKYLPGTGYTLEIYYHDGGFIKSVEFTSADELMPMKAVVDLEGGQTYDYQLRRGGESSAGIYYGNTGTMTYANHGAGTAWEMINTMTGGFQKAGITTNAAGDYTFHLSYSANSANPPQYRLRMAVDYPVATGDYRVVYYDDVKSYWKPSAIVPKVNNGKDTVSFFIRPGSTPYMKIQQASVNSTTGAITWADYYSVPTATLTALSGDKVYNACITMNASGGASVAKIEPYTGNYYIRTDCANNKWDNYRSDPDHLMTYSEYSITHGGYSHYYTHWVKKDDVGRKNVKFTIANDYSPCISDTLARETASGTWANIEHFIEEGGDLKRDANVRFMWNQSTNAISRAYVDGAQGDWSENFLYMLNVEDGADKIKKDDGSALTDHKITFKDNGNWMYEANIKAQPTAQIKLLSNWGTSNTITQYFRGGESTTEELLGGSGDNWYDIRVIYDFKTNRLIAGLIPSGTIDDQMAIHADVMFIRDHHGDIAQLTFAEKGGKMGSITDIETAFGVLQLNKWTLNNKSRDGGHSPLDPLKSRYERDLFYVSFPFKVSMEEVFGFGTYGTHWIIEEYDGANRAANGYWQESDPNWKFITNRKNKFFEPGQGYIIALDLDELGESSSVWQHTDQVELYFPSYGTMPNITSSTATYNIPAHECTINRTVDAQGNPTGLPETYDRRIRDSHWNVLGVPTYVNPNAPSYANTGWITAFGGPNFLYQWNMTDNSVSAVSSSTFTYQAMHAYLVQYCGNVTWTSSVSPTAAPRRNPNYRGSYEFRLELMQNNEAVDQTFVKLTDDEAVTTGFEFNYDMSKEMNKNKANIYTFIGTEEAAGNCLPLTDQTTVVPVGVQIAADGEYIFSMPDGTENIGVTLIDKSNNTRTNLALTDYAVYLETGDHNERFVLEISPIQQIETGVEAVTGDRLPVTGVCKKLIDGVLYIVKDGKVFDARGARIQ